MKHQFYKDKHAEFDKESFEQSIKRISREAFIHTLFQCIPVFIILIIIVIYRICS